MSVLKLKCVDQTLAITNSPVIASGGVEVNELVVEFCERWNGFAKTAVFYRDKNKVYNVPLDMENKCIIPHEVLATDGTLFLGVFGTNGKKKLPSHPLQYKIVEGSLIEGQQPSEPTSDVYSQLMAYYELMGEKYDNIFNNLESTVSGMPAKGFVNLNTGNGVVSFWVGNTEQHSALEEEIDGVIYIITDSKTHVLEADYSNTAGHADTSDVSEKAKQDIEGHNIHQTYQKISDSLFTLYGYLGDEENPTAFRESGVYCMLIPPGTDLKLGYLSREVDYGSSNGILSVPLNGLVYFKVIVDGYYDEEENWIETNDITISYFYKVTTNYDFKEKSLSYPSLAFYYANDEALPYPIYKLNTGGVI